MSDIEQVLRRELDDVATHVRTRRMPATELVAAGRSVRRRRRAVGASLSAAVVVAVLALATSVTGVLSTTPPPPARTPGPVVSSGSANPSPDRSRAAAAWLESWYAALPAKPSTAESSTEDADLEGFVSWRGRQVALPRGTGTPAGDVASAHTSTSRGLLVSWHGHFTGAEDWEQQLGWITPRGRWVRIETGELADLTLSPDGRSYAYTVQSYPGQPFVATVRDIRTDAVSGRYPLPLRKGWMHGWNSRALVLTLPGKEAPGRSDVYTWAPAKGRPTLLAKGWTPRQVTRGTRTLAVRPGEVQTCEYAVLDADRPGSPVAQGCGPATLSPDGRYLVDGLVVTDLDDAGVTELALGRPARPDEQPDLSAQVDTSTWPEVRWDGDRTVVFDVDPSSDGWRPVRCTVPQGPCWRVSG